MRSLIELAPDVWQVPLLPLNGLNAYLVGDVLVDAGLPSSENRLLEAVAGRDVTAHVLTHAHPDHQGASAALCETLEIPLWCGVRDREAAERATFAAARRGPDRPGES
jgi:glyoxylase-like metal-dependent hydrolase (beta-lactamase superfamily II)